MSTADRIQYQVIASSVLALLGTGVWVENYCKHTPSILMYLIVYWTLVALSFWAMQLVINYSKRKK